MLQRRARRLQAAFHHLAKRCSLQDSKSRPVRIIKGQKSGRSTRLSKSPSTKKANFPGMLHSIATFFNVHTSHSMICTILLGEGIIKKKLGWGRPSVPQPNHPHPIPLELVSICIKIKDPRVWSHWQVRFPAGQFGQTGLPGQFGDPVSLISLVNRIILVIPVSLVTSLELGPVNQWLWFQSVKLFDFQSWWVFFISQTMGVACGGGMFNLIMQHFFANQHRPPHPESSSRDSGWIHKHLLSLKMGLYCITDYNKLNGENSDPQSKYLETVSKIFYSYPIYLNIWHWTSGPCGFLTGFPTSALNLLYFLWQSLKGSSR